MFDCVSRPDSRSFDKSRKIDAALIFKTSTLPMNRIDYDTPRPAGLKALKRMSNGQFASDETAFVTDTESDQRFACSGGAYSWL